MMSNDYTVKVGEDWYTYVRDTGDIEKMAMCGKKIYIQILLELVQG